MSYGLQNMGLGKLFRFSSLLPAIPTAGEPAGKALLVTQKEILNVEGR